MIEALIFDLDDTLYDLEVPFRKAYNVVFANTYGKQYNLPVGEVFTAMRDHNNEVYDKSQTGEMSMEAMYTYRITEAMKDFGVSITKEDALHFQSVYHEFQHELELSPNMREFLTFAVRRELKLGIISNGPSVHQREKIQSLGLAQWIPERDTIISEDTGVMKPDPAIFRLAQKRWDLKPETSFYVGDSYDRDVEGAAAAGWHTIWINRRNHKKPENSPYTPDHTVLTEEELTALLTMMIRNLPLRQ